MLRVKMGLIILLFSFVLSGCASTQGTKMDADNLEEVKNVKTVSVAAFECSDPIIAQDVKNKLVESLLSRYSVVLGDNADVLITGAVTLKNDIVSEVKADILKDQDVLATVSVTQSGNLNSPGVMGKKMGEKILGVLSK